MRSLRVYVLGPPRFERDGQTRACHLRRGIALAVYLAVTGRPQARDSLAALLWDDADNATTRARLRRTIHRVSETVGADAIEADGDSLRLSPALDAWVDCHQLSDAGASIGTPDVAEPGADDRLFERLKAADALYVDDFLAGFSLPDCPAWDEWQLLQREQFRQTCGRLREYLVGALRVRGEWSEAIRYARRWLALDVLNEAAHRALMQLYAFSGQRSLALRQYQQCVRALDAELGVPPDEATTALYEAIRTRRFVPAEDVPASPRDGLAGPAPPEPEPAGSSTLPVQRGHLIGRDAETEVVRTLLTRPDVGLVTLTGPGGSGKTRLAIQVAADVAAHFEHGVAFVNLAPISDQLAVPGAVAQALDLRDVGDRPPRERLLLHLRQRRLLLVLDNFEHVVAARSFVSELLSICPGLSVLVTSRAVLHLQDEYEVPVPPLPRPLAGRSSTAAEAWRYPSVELFVERARAARPGFTLDEENVEAVVEICRRLDGLPLAIELAAARVRVLSPRAMLARLDRRLPLLTSGPSDRPARQQTLRGTIAWSDDLLDEAERRLFRCLAVFVGGWSLEAAETVCKAPVGGARAGSGRGDARHPAGCSPDTDLLDGIGSLLDKSLVVAAPDLDGEPRFGMLETIREYALDRLDPVRELAPLRAAHAGYFMALAERADPRLIAREQVAWLARLEGEHANLVAALSWLNEQDGAAEARAMLRLAGALHWFWWLGGRVGEGRGWLGEALARVQPDDTDAAPARARALYAAGTLAMVQGEYADARALLNRAIDAHRGLGDLRGLGHTLAYRAVQDIFDADVASAQARLEESHAILARQGDTWGLALAGSNLASVARRVGKLAEADALLAEHVALARCTGDRYLLGSALPKWANVVIALGDLGRAEAYLGEALSLFRELRDGWWAARCLHILAVVALERGDLERSARLFGASEALLDSAGARLVPSDEARRAQALRLLRERLGDAALDAACAEGRGLSVDRAVAYALG